MRYLNKALGITEMLVISLFVAFIMAVPDLLALDQESHAIDKQKGKDVSEFLTPDGRIDLEAVHKSKYQGSLNTEGYDIQFDPQSGEPIVTPSVSKKPADNPDDTNWVRGFCPTGVSSSVYALTIYGNQLIVGGWFYLAGGITANYIAAWDGSSWSALGSGMNGFVQALTVYDDQLIAGGSFSSAGGISTNCIAAWDGTDWSALGSGLDEWVRALTIFNSQIVGGGDFAFAGGKQSSYIAFWQNPSSNCCLEWGIVGDSNKDGIFNLSDILNCISYIYVEPYGEPQATDGCNALYDANGDGESADNPHINLTDALNMISNLYVEPVGWPTICCPPGCQVP